MIKNLWDNVIKDILTTDGEVRTIGVDFYKNTNGEFNQIIDLWQSANYTSVQVEWINYYPEVHFDKNIEEKFSDRVNLNPVRSWISCVRPGKNAPWHQDIDDNLSIYKSLGDLVRYTCFIREPCQGQLLLIENKSYYMQPKNSLIRWDNFLAWHGAANCGFENHYLYHFIGYT